MLMRDICGFANAGFANLYIVKIMVSFGNNGVKFKVVAAQIARFPPNAKNSGSIHRLAEVDNVDTRIGD